MRFPYSYKKVHVELRRLHGPAKNHMCQCGEPAVEWAYQFTGVELRADDGSRPHSADPDDYLPMCRKCHQRLDMEKDTVMAERRRNSGGFRQGLADKWADPTFAEKMRGVLLKNSLDIAERNKEPERAEAMRERGRHAGKVRAERMKNDPEFAAQVTATLRANANVRKRCNVCGLVSNSAGMGNHRRWSGHDDWDFVNEEEEE